MNKQWIKAAGIRAIKTMAQTAVALLGTGAVGIFDADWVGALSVTVMAGILSVLTSIAGLPEVGEAASVSGIEDGETVGTVGDTEGDEV